MDCVVFVRYVTISIYFIVSVFELEALVLNFYNLEFLPFDKFYYYFL